MHALGRAVVVLVSLAGIGLSAGCQTPTTAEAIASSSAQAPNGQAGRPLPLASHWCTGSHTLSQPYGPDMQLTLVAQGHYVLPWLAHPSISAEPSEKEQAHFVWYGYDRFMPRLAEAHLPFTLIASQWESRLSTEPYLSLPPERNPNVIAPDGEVKKMV